MKGVTPLALLLLGLAAAALPFFAGDYYIGVGLSVLLYIALTQSWIVLSGMTGYVSLGHVVFYGLGGYAAALLWGEIPLAAIVPLAGIAAFALAVLIGLPVLRVRGPYFVILTFGVAELGKYIVIAVEGWLGKYSRVLFGAPDLSTLFYIMLGLAAGATAITLAVRGSRFGRGLLAIRENEEAAETVGVPTVRFKLFAFGLSALIPGMVGSVMVLRSTYFEPQQLFDPIISFSIVTMAVVGGSDDVKGPLLGAGAFVVLSELLWANAPQLYMILVGLLLIVFVMFVPEGLAGRLFPAQRRAKAAP
ncbi:MAG: branched-chain amino acid ABC transporter permease [Rhodospirillaceae bacterium]|nr:branched-chain amino acid ABC transporter permease [Rhodospirillaceae bacterium]